MEQSGESAARRIMAPAPHEASRADAAARVRDMLSLLQQKAPKLCPNIVPKALKQLDLLGICATREQREAVQALLQEKRQDDSQKLVVLSSVDLDAGVFRLLSAKYVSEIEADIYDVDRMMGLFLKGESDELTVRLQHFLSVNGHDEMDVTTAQEVYNLAYAVAVCLCTAPLRAMLANTPVPVDADADAEALVMSLFEPPSASTGKGKRKQTQQQQTGSRVKLSEGVAKKR